MLYFIVTIFSTFIAGRAYPELQCDWSNDLDKSNNYNLLGGQYSYKSNNGNKREYKWKYCNINSSNMDSISLPKTLIDDSFDRGCGGNTALNYVEMDINDYEYQCSSLGNEYILKECKWTNWLNNENEMVSYQCRNNGLIRTIMSDFNKQKNDRRFKFECCMVDDNDYEYPEMNCKTDNAYRNEIGEDLSFKGTNVALSGIKSIHDTGSKDRQFKLSRCKPKKGNNNVIKALSMLQPSVWEGSWLRTCKDRNNGNSVITGIVSQFDELKQDRQFTFECGNLNNDKYSLVNCGFTGYLNDWNGLLDFKCPNNGVIRSIGSQFMNGYDDRQFKVECCQIATNSFSDVIGEWIPIKPCHECDKNEYKIYSGVMSTRLSDVSNKYRDELKKIISKGYDYNGVFSNNLSMNMKISEMYADRTVKTLKKELDQSEMKPASVKCDKQYSYQWRQSIKDMLPNVGNYDVFVYSNDIVCSDNMPQCPLGWCKDIKCNECKDNMMFYKQDSAKNVDENVINDGVIINDDKQVNINADDNNDNNVVNNNENNVNDNDNVNNVNKVNDNDNDDNNVINNNDGNDEDNINDNNTDTNKISTDINGLYYHGINVTKPFAYTLLGFIAIAISCGVFMCSIKSLRFNKKRFVYKPVNIDTTTSNSDVTDIIDSVGV